MKNLYLLVPILFMIFYSEYSRSEFRTGGPSEGFWVNYYDNGQIKSEGSRRVSATRRREKAVIRLRRIRVDGY